ncbi:ATP-dependent DNA ligase [Ornithinimicrobium sp. Arc0846-15]|nr:ATP-dependent DNA ligase [Ornithinimicrobium laminariae]
MQLARVVEASQELARTSSRKGKVEAVAQVLREAVTELKVVPVVADYLSGVLPQRRIGVSWRSLRELPQPAHQPNLEVAEVDQAFSTIGQLRGAGSQSLRREALDALFARATAAEQKWLRGLLTGEVRQGAGDGIMIQAITAASGVPDAVVRRAVMIAGFAAPVAAIAMSQDSPGAARQAVKQVTLQVGRPLRPMLAAAAPTAAEGLEALQPQGGDVAVEAKLDGIRIQAHVDHREDTVVRLFTRTLDDITDRLPEVVEVLSALPLEQAVFDGEVIAQRADGSPEPFQVTGARTASSADVAQLREQVPLTTYLFDVLHLNGEDLLDQGGAERWQRLAQVAPDLLVPRLVTSDSEAAQDFFAELVAAGQEGVVLKSIDQPYAAGRRGAGWIKVKPRHTYDLVVVAVEQGSGRRKGWLSNIHLAARGEDGELVMVGKTFKGMTDEMLAWQTQRFTELATNTDGYVVQVRPEQVVEIAIDGVQRSTRYAGGLALRFARVLRYREDKPVAEIATMADLRHLL